MDRFMKLALALAGKADPSPNPRVGAVLVKGGKVIGQGYHHKAGLPHAEIEAMRDATAVYGAGVVRGATLYVTLEPCSHRLKRTPPCTDEIIRAGISKVVYGMRDPNPLVSGASALRKAGIAVQGPAAAKEARAMNERYADSVGKRPFVAIKMAMSADGKTAPRGGESKHSISGPEAMRFVHRLRAEYDAVMVGAGTVRADDPRLTCRIAGGRDPLRVIVDGRLTTPPGSALLRNKDGKTFIATSEAAPAERVAEIATSTQAHVMVCSGGTVDLRQLVDALGAMGARKVLIEGGSELNAEALKAGIVDRLYLIVAPKIIGGRETKGVVGGEGIERMAQAIRLGEPKVSRLGQDVLLQYEIIRRP